MPSALAQDGELLLSESKLALNTDTGRKTVVSGWKRRHRKFQCTPYDKKQYRRRKNIRLLRYFFPMFPYLPGTGKRRIRLKNILRSIITAPLGQEVIPLFPGNAEEERIRNYLPLHFRLSSDEFGYEIKLRETLTEIWLICF